MAATSDGMHTTGLLGGLAYLGPYIDHPNNLERLLQQHGRALVRIEDSATWVAAAPQPTSGRLAVRVGRLRAQLSGTSDHNYLDYALRLIDEGDVRCVLAYWGTRPLPDIKALKRLRPRVKFVLNLLCHPLHLTRVPVLLENRLLGRAMEFLDGLIVSNSVMRRYLEAEVSGSRRVPTLTLPPYWCADLGPSVDLPPALAQPNVLFMGRMDWRSGQPSDNVTSSLRELMREGIDVHFSRSAESAIAEPHACAFDAVPLAQVANFAAKFDASLIVYNMAAIAVPDRFENTVPDRLITSVAARVPIALPARGFSGCREYLRDYEAVIEYESMAHLATQLRDRERIDGLRKLARERGNRFHAEVNFGRPAAIPRASAARARVALKNLRLSREV